MIKAMDGSERGEQFWMDTVRTQLSSLMPQQGALRDWLSPATLEAHRRWPSASMVIGARHDDNGDDGDDGDGVVDVDDEEQNRDSSG